MPVNRRPTNMSLGEKAGAFLCNSKTGTRAVTPLKNVGVEQIGGRMEPDEQPVCAVQPTLRERPQPQRRTALMQVPLKARAVRRGGRIMFGDQTLFCRACDLARVGGFDPALRIMEDADLCVRMHMAGPEQPPARASGSGSQTLHSDHCAAAAAAAAAAAGAAESRARDGKAPASAPGLSGSAGSRAQGSGVEGELSALAAAVRGWARRRGWVRMVLDPPSMTSGRRLAALGNPRATYVHVVIGMSWYLGASPQQLDALYERLYTDRIR